MTIYGRTRWPLYLTYPGFGLLLGVGNAIGLLLFRFVYLREQAPRPWIAAELHALTPSLAYLALSTMAIVVALGYLIGRRGDRLCAECASDYLTGLANRRQFERRLKEELLRTARYRTPFALLIADVDHFKTINEMRGHQAGDNALRVLGQCLRKECRMTDFAARWGGDEFAIIVPKSTVVEATLLAERLATAVRTLSSQRHFSAHFSGQATVPRLSLSIGIAMADHSNAERMNPERLFVAADAALRLAKVAGGDRVVSADALVASNLSLDVRAANEFEAIPFLTRDTHVVSHTARTSALAYRKSDSFDESS